MNVFHLAIPVKNLELTRQFYRETLECTEGRSSVSWVDFNFFGHQLVIHQKEGVSVTKPTISTTVDGKDVPVPHFGVVLEWDKWIELSKMLIEKHIKFNIEPHVRFEGEVGEQATLFFFDPENNALEFKAFRNPDNLFEK